VADGYLSGKDGTAMTEFPSLSGLDVKPDPLAASNGHRQADDDMWAGTDADSPAGAPEPADPDAPNQATALIKLARDNYQFIRTPDGQAYAVRKDGPNVAIPIGRTGTFASHLTRLFYETEGKAPSDQAERQAVKILRAYLDDQEPELVHLRVAQHNGGFVLDLATADGMCVVGSPAGWTIQSRSPVTFRRGLCLPLTVPARGEGGLGKLHALINADEAQFRLTVGWLVAALFPDIPHPLLTPRGEQGSAKTTFCGTCQRIIDPSAADAVSMPKDDRDFAVLMDNVYIPVFDNVSIVPDWFSDMLCRAATKGSFATRTLYTDRDMTVMRFRRPMILNTIDAGALNGDLIERSLPQDLRRIKPEDRKPERAALGDDPQQRPGINDLLDQDHAVILGAILDLACTVLKEASAVSPEKLPRMADFGKVLAVLDKTQKWGAFKRYTELVDVETGVLLENSPFALELVKFINERGEWTGTATELRDVLTSRLPEDRRPPNRPPRGWPADAPRAGSLISRMAPSLRVHGIEAEKDREGKSRTRTWNFQKVLSAQSALSANNDFPGQEGDGADSADSNPAGRRTVTPGRTVSPDITVRPVSAGQATLADSADGRTVDPGKEHTADSSPAGDPWVREPPDDYGGDFPSPEGSPGTPVGGHRWAASETGPCTRCKRPCHRYGDGGRNLCTGCQDSQPTPLTMPPRRQL
jgi:hypothetical protein